jgi:hypothetical protein
MTKYCQRSKAADEAIAGLQASKTLARAREAVRYGANPAMLKALGKGDG